MKNYLLSAILTSLAYQSRLTRVQSFQIISLNLSPWLGGHHSLSRRCLSTMEENGEFEKSENVVQPGHVYYVATPLGNLGDITYRSMKVLKGVDIICCEDKRKTSSLLKLLDLPFKTFINHHEHNQFETIDEIVIKAKEGKSIAVVTDAGTPGISDPGSPLAAALARNDVPIHPIPGPSAVISALSVSGFSSSPFTFIGFLPVKGKEKTKMMEIISSSSHTLVLYEAPHRIVRFFKAISNVPGMKERPCVCCRELTKKFEEFRRGTVEEMLQFYLAAEENSKKGPIKGEFTIVIGPDPNERKAKKQRRQSLEDLQSVAPHTKQESDDEDDEDSDEDADKADDRSREQDSCKEKKKVEIAPSGSEAAPVVTDKAVPAQPAENKNSRKTKLVDLVRNELIMERDRGHSRKDAVANVCTTLKVSKKPVYQMSLDIPWNS